MDDPKKRLKPLDDTDDDDLREQIADLQATVRALAARSVSSGGMDEAVLEKILTRVAAMSAEAMERAANPSNKSHPGVSVYSYPEGDRARPRALKCPMFWVGYPLDLDTTSAHEIELLNQAEPGVYQFRRTDGSLDTLTVDGPPRPGGGYDRLLFTFMTRERQESLPSMVEMLQTAFGIKTPAQRELDRLRTELETLRAQALVAV